MKTPPIVPPAANSGQVAIENYRHPHLFSAEEAIKYLNLPSKHSLTHLRSKGLLKGIRLGLEFQYLRSDLDAVIMALHRQTHG